MKKNIKNIKVKIQNPKSRYKFIWGVKSPFAFVWGVKFPNSTNDIEIIYDTKTDKYILNVVSNYRFDSHKDEAKYLLNLLAYFTDFMKRNNYDMEDPYYYFAWAPEISTEANSISELYTMFKIFVRGYESVYYNDNN